MNFNSSSAIKFDELYIFVLKNIEQKCVFNAINISLSTASNLNHLMTVIQHSEFTAKFFSKSLTSSVISTKINNMKALMKAMKTMILAMTVTAS